ncbi:PTS sugar transporter subunit IIA [Bulleidia sp. zg-1006]|uniref:PTS sugar transporter subunit IIA n=1 Tax=Bulleidia sp. zg-1006 TaxID=2806552 RepID=UPI00193A5D40|nr:PTS sugar transporter subunit IIA [Bulleidia sp. zg-1006]QRG86970.1 PTS sugar transporter subunit IIA [Bulleidia sp. zg-1006]
MNYLISPQYVLVKDKTESWQEALELASKPILDDKKIVKQYIEEMKNSVIQNGPYMVLTDYFALMHAKPSQYVNEQAMSLLVLKEAVDLLGKPVKIMLVLATKDNHSHLESLQKIVSIFGNQKYFECILNGNIEEIKEMMKEVGK